MTNLMQSVRIPARTAETANNIKFSRQVISKSIARRRDRGPDVASRPALPLHKRRHEEQPRRFPAPWHADKMPGGYVVRDANGQALVYLYSRDNPDEARRIALNIARLPELLGKAEP
jgi:hypothetical protein